MRCCCCYLCNYVIPFIIIPRAYFWLFRIGCDAFSCLYNGAKPQALYGALKGLALFCTLSSCHAHSVVLAGSGRSSRLSAGKSCMALLCISLHKLTKAHISQPHVAILYWNPSRHKIANIHVALISRCLEFYTRNSRQTLV